jgi:hypothetical protein
MPMQETFFAFRFSMLRDKFGTSWMIFHQRPAPPSPSDGAGQRPRADSSRSPVSHAPFRYSSHT